MNKEKAHELLTKHCSDQNQECRCHSCDRLNGFLEGYAEAEKKILEKVINVLNNYPDITVDDSVRLKNEIYEAFPQYEKELGE